MIQSMTGFASREVEISPLGKVCIEIKSANHKFLDIVIHVPAGFLALEDRIKKEIESKIKRGRITCVLNLIGAKAPNVFINKPLLKKYIAVLSATRKEFRLDNDVTMDTLIHLPGVLSLAEDRMSDINIWPRLEIMLDNALNDLSRTRQREGRAMSVYLKNRAENTRKTLAFIKERVKIFIKNKNSQFKTDEERTSFLRESDITEEIERLDFHIRNFKNKLQRSGPVGKELDFIAQEMLRETNTIASKSSDKSISARVIQIKSQIEKIREQVQNIE